VDHTSTDNAKKFAVELLEQTKSLGNIKYNQSTSQIVAPQELEISLKNTERTDKKDFAMQKGVSLIRHKQRLGLINIELSPKVNCANPTMIFRNAQIRFYKTQAKTNTFLSYTHSSQRALHSNNEFSAIHRRLNTNSGDREKIRVFC
jgi:hypothetical protein